MMFLKEGQPAWPFPQTDSFAMPAKPTTQPRARFENENRFYQRLISNDACLVNPKHLPVELSTQFFQVELAPSWLAETLIM